jgi:predicted esterase
MISSFVHQFIPSALPPPPPCLLLLHGTGGNESDLLPLGEMLDGASAMLSPRGKVLENGQPRFFRRLAEGVFDIEDLKARTEELANWVNEAVRFDKVDPGRISAVGYSNGANIAAAMLMLRPEVLSRAVLFRPMVPLVVEDLPDLSMVQVFMSSARQDQIVSPDEPLRLKEMLEKAEATVTLHWINGGHNLTPEDIESAREWMSLPGANE